MRTGLENDPPITNVEVTEIPTHYHLSDEENDMGREDCCQGESCQFAKVAEMEMALLMKGSRHGSERLSNVNDFISQKVQINHMEEGTKVGTREAAAMQRMDQDKSSNKAMEMATAVAAGKQ